MLVAKQQNPLKEPTLEPNNSDSDLDGDAMHVPIDPLLEAKLTSTQPKDDVDAFVQKTQWYQAFKHLPYV